MPHTEKYLNAMHQSVLLTNQMVRDVETIVELVLEVESTYILAGLKITHATESEHLGLQSKFCLPNFMLKRELVKLNTSLTDLKKSIEKNINQSIFTLKNVPLTEEVDPCGDINAATSKAFDEYKSAMLTCISVLESLGDRLFDAEVKLTHTR
ncbi:hypothetical protein SOM59_21155 [Pseudomonas coleopterorum]|uniref:hypothetical protein n=1 Tax=Pseudomonas coleopterorum TaxID=1605838 RepID=UPI002A6A4DB9|nr:hypothetical protein [Pseudomonas coleopterorum]MDY1019586.1 hypothetical protein [Pseudomonas coleopterorum]